MPSCPNACLRAGAARAEAASRRQLRLMNAQKVTHSRRGMAECWLPLLQNEPDTKTPTPAMTQRAAPPRAEPTGSETSATMRSRAGDE